MAQRDRYIVRFWGDDGKEALPMIEDVIDFSFSETENWVMIRLDRQEIFVRMDSRIRSISVDSIIGKDV